MTTDSLSIGLEIVPQGRESIDLEPRYDVGGPQVVGAPDLDAAHAKEGHLPGAGAHPPGAGQDHADQK